MTDIELDWLVAHAAKMESVVEVGCWRGRSTVALCEACPGTVIAVDQWRDDDAALPDTEFFLSLGGCAAAYRDFLENTRRFANLRVERRSSVEAASLFLSNSVDMVFIDANYSYEAVLRDIRAWLPKARKLICGHDYMCGAVRQAVDELLSNVSVCDTIWSVAL